MRDIIDAPIVQTPDGYYRFIDHARKLASTGFGTPQGLQKNADIIRQDASGLRAMRSRYRETFGPKRWTLAEIKAANERAGFYFFSRDTMRFFGDTMRSFAVRHIDGKVYIQRVRRARNAPAGALSTELRLFNPETGDIGIPKAIDNDN